MNFLQNITDETIYTVENVDRLLQAVPKEFVQKNRKKIYNIPCAFDIETSSFYEDGEKRACMYIWQFGIDGSCVIGRTWSEFLLLCDKLVTALQLGKYRLIVYVHNLGYEFQWIRKLFEWKKVFCIGSRNPAYARAKLEIEFRDSLMLSGYSLEKTAEHLQCVQLQKQHSLDYSLIRHTRTPLTPEELKYCVYDIKIVMAYVYDKIQQDGGLNRIPMTKTGYVRRLISKYVLSSWYRWLIRDCTLTVEAYQISSRALMGGFVHANPKYVGKVLSNASSWDFTSSYPYTCLSEKYPIGKPEKIEHIDKKTFEVSIAKYCCIFEVMFEGLRPKVTFDNYLSESRCQLLENPVINNGRVVSADRLVITFTNVDYDIMTRFYEWDKIKIRTFYRWQRDYLPKPIIQAILDLYQIKTELKGVAGKEVEYLAGKENINSVYGMMVTSIVMDLITYDDDYHVETPNTEWTLEKYNNNYGRFLYYPWGVFVTAYARRNITRGVIEFGDDYIYSDTDSIKGLHSERHMDYINKYNALCDKKLKKMCDYYHIDFARTRPKTIKGVEKPLGHYDCDGIYRRFKTLGAKRYAYETDDGFHITVSGLNSKIAAKYIESLGDPFEVFSNHLYVPPEHTGKNTHTYIDEMTSGVVTDYTGAEAPYHEMSSIHLEPVGYNLNLSNQFLNFLERVIMYEGRKDN